MENISKKRGRPKRFSEDMKAIYEATGLFTDVHSDRARTNIMYRQTAMAVLSEDGGNAKYGWLFDFDCMNEKSTGVKPRFTLLAELGRIGDPAGICAMAKMICERKPSTRLGIAAIRQYRGVRADKPTKTLTDELTSVIDDYRQRYPNTEWQEILDALSETIEIVNLVRHSH